MALEAPLRQSTGSLNFAFGTQPDMSAPDFEAPRSSSARIVSAPPPPTDSASLRPHSANRFSSQSMNVLSPSDIVGPSPVTSNGTEITEIEDEATEGILEAPIEDFKDRRRQSEILMLSTNIPDSVRQGSEEAVSVIHAPESFASWKSTYATGQDLQIKRHSPKDDEISLSSLSEASYSTSDHQQPPRPPLSTDVKPVRYGVDGATPMAQNLQDMLSDSSRLRSSSTSSLEKIDEQTENEDNDEDDYASHYGIFRQEDNEITSLRTALHECWTLCNTLANMSYIHRARVFHSSGTPDAHEKAWKACWKLCQRLYDYRDDEADSINVRMSLDLCRDFCQALFDVRQRKDEASDCVLRVSFELNNHLYSAQDSRNLPEPFRERTLDFYITLCHRLMKQRTDLSEETDQLLRSCWSLAEMLFSLRQNQRDGRPPDEELLSSAVHACWDLMDIFRHGWSQVHPDRNTPRPSQMGFFPQQQQQSELSGRESRQSARSSHSRRDSVKSAHQEERPRVPPPVPETPVTEFEDTPVSPESRSPQMPNIMVLGTSSDSGRGGRWSSNASNLSTYSHGSTRTSSTATTSANPEEPNIARAKMLVLRAAMNLGFNRDNVTDPKSGSIALQKFVQALPQGSFGPLPANATLLQQYKNSVLTDAIIPRYHALPSKGKRATAADIAKSISIVCKSSSRYNYLRDLFRFVFSFSVDDVDPRRNISIVV